MLGVKPGIYRHYKGGLYNVIGTCNMVKPRQKYEMDANKLVLYKSYVNDQKLNMEMSQYWLRPIDIFLENVTPTKPRFHYVGSDFTNSANECDVVAFNTEEELYYRAFRHMSFWFCFRL